MIRNLKTVTILLLACSITGFADMHKEKPEQLYRVTIENLSEGQAFTPPLIATHNQYVKLYTVGETANAYIQAVAENGNTAPLMDALSADANVADVVMSDAGPLVPASNPGGTNFASSVNLTISTNRYAHYLSFVSMLICTNDGFTALNAVALPKRGSRVIFVSGLDAGTEMNTEDFADLVPPCQGLIGVSSDDSGTGESNPALAEGGVIHYHGGIMGGNDLSPDVHGWSNPVAKITITCLNDSANHFMAPLSGAGHLPPVHTYATGLAEFKIDWENRKIYYRVYAGGLSGATQAHVHVGLPNENGGVSAFLFGPSAPTGLIEGTLSRGNIAEGDLIGGHAGDFDGFVAGLRNGEFYVNVHTADNPPGALRGQIGAVYPMKDNDSRD